MDKLRELVAKWRIRGSYAILEQVAINECADELEAVLASQPEAQPKEK